MPIINLLVILAVIGFLLWLLQMYVPMNATIKKVIIGIVIVATIIWLLGVFGLLSMGGTVPRFHR